MWELELVIRAGQRLSFKLGAFEVCENRDGNLCLVDLGEIVRASFLHVTRR